MGFTYLQNRNWNDVTRDERWYCSYLYHTYLKGKEHDFIAWLQNNGIIMFQPHELNLSYEWEASIEVCLYRDIMNFYNFTSPIFSKKRTFDICLFSDERIIIIEAKVCENFDKDDFVRYYRDRIHLPLLFRKLKKRSPKINIISLTQSHKKDSLKTKIANAEINGHIHRRVRIFDNFITWDQLHKLWKDNILGSANVKK